ncbi:MAG: UDP-N-acetylglucosamine 1-carboxyvinyltransferase [Oligosphaeraceae bacterium]
MKALEIPGPQRAVGTLRVEGNKNAALPMIAAALLTEEPVLLHGVPPILDVRNMLEIARELGVRIQWQDGDSLLLQADTLRSSSPSQSLCHALRTSLLFAGPLAARTGEAHLPHPGGDVIGRRRIDPHLYGLERLGVVCTPKDGAYHFAKGPQGLHAAPLFLDEASVTATEHIMMTAVLAPGVTTLRNAACEPHVTQLAQLLNAMGADIQGVETNLLRIRGVEKLHGAEFTINADHVNAASYLALAAATGGEVELTGNLVPHDFWSTKRVFQRLGANLQLEPGRITLKQDEPLLVRPDLDNSMPTIADGPWPQFPSDMMSCLIVAASQARGSVLFFEKMFESRLYFVDRLISMGANAVICDPHRVVVAGPSRLHAAELLSPDIRAGMALVIAACCATGTSLIRNADMIERGYAHLTQSLNALHIQLQEREL